MTGTPSLMDLYYQLDTIQKLVIERLQADQPEKTLEEGHRLGYSSSGSNGFAVISKTGGVPLAVANKPKFVAKNGPVVVKKPVSKAMTSAFSEMLRDKVKKCGKTAKFYCRSESTRYGKPQGKLCNFWSHSQEVALGHKVNCSHKVATRAAVEAALGI